MSRDRIERAYDREQGAIDRAFEDGDLSNDEYRAQTRELERDARDAVRGEMEDEIERVRQDYERKLVDLRGVFYGVPRL